MIGGWIVCSVTGQELGTTTMHACVDNNASCVTTLHAFRIVESISWFPLPTHLNAQLIY
jgi:hypothetical protein